MPTTLQKIQAFIAGHTIISFRIILFLVFTGHAMVSFGFSANYDLHYNIFKAVNFFNWDIPSFLNYQASFDVFLAITILAGLLPRYILSVALVYLVLVAGAGYWFYHFKTGSFMGFAESFRRFAWIFYVIFLWIHFVRKKNVYSLLRVGIAFAFIAHGFASLGSFGMRGGHIELARQFFSEDVATKIVFYSGFSDGILGILMLLGIFSRPAAIIGSVWLVVVVVLSFIMAWPDGIFRLGFLLSCIYVALDKRCHNLIWQKGYVEEIQPAT